MGFDFSLDDLYDALNNLGIHIPQNVLSVIAIFVSVIILLFVTIEIIKFILNIFKFILHYARPLFYKDVDKEFVKERKVIVEHMIYEVQRMNREADWNSFFYTELEAEVEVDPISININYSANEAIVKIYSIISTIRGIISRPRRMVEKSLINAILHSKSRAFLIIGDPGSGKTVSLRQLFLRLAEKCLKSKNKFDLIPVYINLKYLNISPDIISTDTIHAWVIDQLEKNQDRITHIFLDNRFEEILRDGGFFFIFDSFDEIPSIMDAHEDGEIVQKYAKAIEGFILGPHKSRGLLCSRPYRAPKIFMGQKMTIRPLSPKLVEMTLRKYLFRKRNLAQRSWYETISQKETLLKVIQTPFYLALLAKFIEERNQLPNRHYELFEEFVTIRTLSDEQKIRRLGYTPENLLNHASILAYKMTTDSNLGLEISIERAVEILDQSINVESLFEALSYCKLGRKSIGDFENPTSFSFSHRRFHEYFVARYLIKESQPAPFIELVEDNRWREILVLLCEVLPIQELSEVFSFSTNVISEGLSSLPNSKEFQRSIECMRFLKDGFLTRINDVPLNIRTLVSRFLLQQFARDQLLEEVEILLTVSPNDVNGVIQLIQNHIVDEKLADDLRKSPPTSIIELFELLNNNEKPNKPKVLFFRKHKNQQEDFNPEELIRVIKKNVCKNGNLLNQKRAIEILPLADELTAPKIAEIALHSNSAWIQETAFRSCRIVLNPSEKLLKKLRMKILEKYTNFELFRDFSLYCVLFSSGHDFNSIYKFLKYIQIAGKITIISSLLLIAGFSIFAPAYVLTMAIIMLQIFAIGLSIRPNRLNKGVYLTILILLISFTVISGFFHQTVIFKPSFTLFLLPIILPNVLIYCLALKFPSSVNQLIFLPLFIFRDLFFEIKELALLFGKNRKAISIFILFFIGMALLMYCIANGLKKLFTCNYEIQCFVNSGSIFDFICIVLLLSIFIYSILVIIRLFRWNLVNYLHDQVIFRLMFANPTHRPQSTEDAMKKLSSFATLEIKILYIKQLQSWLSNSKDWQIIFIEAKRHEVAVQDELYKLIEIWQDLE